ncbi:hypothetical protein [Actinomadura sp. 9N407]|uniref:hypothetical protein n=1 Tax=Actinomadura sp. 9N407 TaxID=3375154 RepID=UPI003799D8E7
MATTKAQAPAVSSRRWAALFFIGPAHLMISDGDRQWIITAYTLAFGSLLLGGRIADHTGRKRTFQIGLLGFAAASALGGAAGNFEISLSKIVDWRTRAAVAWCPHHLCGHLHDGGRDAADCGLRSPSSWHPSARLAGARSPVRRGGHMYDLV